MRLTLGAGLLATWTAWMCWGEVTVRHATPRARLEASQAAHAVDVPHSGSIVRASLELGKAVRVGDVLVELDATDATRAVAEATARVDSLRDDIVALDTRIERETSLRPTRDEKTNATSQEALAKVSECEEEVRQARDRAERLERAGSTISENERVRARGDLRLAEERIERARAEVRRLHSEDLLETRTAELAVESLRAERIALAGDLREAEESLATARAQLMTRTVFAPIDGILGDVQPLRPGQYLAEGTTIARIVPRSPLRAIAQFPVETSLGRVRPGQIAIMRLDGYPWTEYGTVPLRVRTVGSESNEHGVRVELAIDATHAHKFSGELAHGLTGTVEIEVEHAAPLQMLLRHVGAIAKAKAQPIESAAREPAHGEIE